MNTPKPIIKPSQNKVAASRTTLGTKKIAIIQGIESARRRLLVAVKSLPPGSEDTVFLGEWTIKELLAHLSGWDHTNLEAVRQMSAGLFPTFFQYYDRDWQSYNRILVERYRRENLEAYLQQAEETHAVLISALSDMDPDTLVNGKVLSPRGRTVTIRNLLISEAHDEEIHARQVEVFSASYMA